MVMMEEWGQIWMWLVDGVVPLEIISQLFVSYVCDVTITDDSRFYDYRN